MPLETFGAVLSFAAELESGDGDFYRSAAARAGDTPLGRCLADCAEDCARGARLALRARQEHVTEMILEPIQGLRREAFQPRARALADLAPEELVPAARERAASAERFYASSGEALKALPEVARVLRSLGKKRRTHREALENPMS
jgi:hypothetical protein